MMDNCHCSYRCDCTALSVVASIILGIITGFLAFSGTITLTPAFFSLLITWAACLVKLRPDVTIKQKGAQKYSVHLFIS